MSVFMDFLAFMAILILAGIWGELEKIRRQLEKSKGH